MKIAYIFQIYKDFDYHAKVFKMLKEPWCDIYVHIDKKSKINLNKYIKDYGLQDIHFLKNRMAVYWGGFTQIQAILKLFEEVHNSGIKYDRIIFMTDNEFPCWSNQKIYDFFEQNKGIEFLSIATQNAKKMGNFEYPESRVNTFTFYDCPLTKFFPRIVVTKYMYRFQLFQRYVLGFSRKLLPFKYYRANSKFYITQEFMEYVLDYVKNNPKDLNTFKHTCCADEVFISTIFMNSKFKNKLFNKLFRYHVWGNLGPIALDIRHKEKIEKVNPFICAKIVPGESDELMNYLIERRNNS